MGFKRTVPKSVEELHSYVQKVHESRGHVKSVKLDETTNHLEVDLDWSANHLGGYPDVYLPIKRGKEADARQLIDQILKSAEPPNLGTAAHLFALIDPLVL